MRQPPDRQALKGQNKFDASEECGGRGVGGVAFKARPRKGRSGKFMAASARHNGKDDRVRAAKLCILEGC